MNIMEMCGLFNIFVRGPILDPTGDRMNAEENVSVLQSQVGGKKIMNVADYLILAAAGFSFLLSVGLWFNGSKEQGLYVGLWVPSIISTGIYFRVLMGAKK